jgi:mono/diheme cytochrome c family protein
MMRRWALLACTVVLLAACGSSAEGLYGQELFTHSCARCHSADGGGSSMAPAIGPGSNAATLQDDQIAAVIEVGPGAMPSFGRLTPEQIDSLVAYVRTLQDG